MTEVTTERQLSPAKNSLFSLVAFLWPIFLSFVSTPFIIHHLGNENYGILALVTSFIGFFGFLDFGISPSLVKYTAEYRAKNELEKLSRMFSSALFFYVIIGLIAAVVIAIFANFFATGIIKVAADNQHTLRTVLFIAAAGFMVNMILTAFSAIPGALQRFDLTSYVNLLISTMATIATVAFVAMGKGVVAVSIQAVAFSITAIIIYRAINARLVPHLRFTPKFDRASARLMFSFGIYTAITSIASVILFQLDKLYLASALGASIVTYYVIPGNLAIKIHGLIAAITTVIFPLSSALLATENYTKLANLYERATKNVFLIIVIGFTPIYPLAASLLHYWLGADFASHSTTTLQLLVGTYSVLALTAIPFYILYGAAQPRLTAINAGVSAALNVTLLFLLVPKYGINGAALAYLLSVIPGALYFLFYVERNIVRVNTAQMYARFLPKLSIITLCGLVIGWLLNGVVHNLLGFLIMYALTICAMILTAVALKIFEPDDIALMKRIGAKIMGQKLNEA